MFVICDGGEHKEQDARDRVARIGMHDAAQSHVMHVQPGFLAHLAAGGRVDVFARLDVAAQPVVAAGPQTLLWRRPAATAPLRRA